MTFDQGTAFADYRYLEQQTKFIAANDLKIITSNQPACPRQRSYCLTKGNVNQLPVS